MARILTTGASMQSLKSRRGSFTSRAPIIALVAIPGLAMASLGGDVASVQADGVHLRGALAVREMPQYSRHEIAQANGTLVRQYVSPSGQVFAVSWQGPVVPELKQVLGAYFDQYVGAAKAARIRRAPIVIQDASLVVVAAGHPRAFSGRAYVPSLVPPGVDPEALQ
jgi:hypothetical protein